MPDTNHAKERSAPNTGAFDSESKQTYENGSIHPYGLMALTQEEANYSPFGFRDQQGCATCRFFFPSSNSCLVVQGAIVPTGLSDLYNPLRPEDQMSELLADFTETMGDMEIGAAAMNEPSEEKTKAKMTLFERLFRRKSKEAAPPQFDTPTGFKTVGDNMWVAWYTNPYQDRDGEWFAEKAIDNDLAFMQETGNYPELWRYHVGIPGKSSPTRHGKAIAATKSGRFLVAFGEFDDTPIARAMKAYYKEHPDQGVSHGFYYDPEKKIGNVYHKFHTFEISTLPNTKASNPYADFAIKEGTKEMATPNADQLNDLKAALQGRIPDNALEDILKAADQKSAVLDTQVSYKQAGAETKEESAKEPELSADTKAILGAFGNLQAAVTGMQGEIAGLKAAMVKPADPDDEDDDETEGGKKPKKTGKAARNTAQNLSPEIKGMLRDLISEKGINEGASSLEKRETDPGTIVLTKMFGGNQ